MITLGNIKTAKGATKQRKRLGRGTATGHGGTAGKGNKGQLARSGGVSRIGFEGGQNPLYRRLPKRGFSNNFAVSMVSINLHQIARGNLKEVSMQSLKEARLIKGTFDRLKILGTGKIDKALKFSVHAISKSAEEKIKKAGGTVEILK